MKKEIVRMIEVIITAPKIDKYIAMIPDMPQTLHNKVIEGIGGIVFSMLSLLEDRNYATNAIAAAIALALLGYANDNGGVPPVMSKDDIEGLDGDDFKPPFDPTLN